MKTVGCLLMLLCCAVGGSLSAQEVEVVSAEVLAVSDSLGPEVTGVDFSEAALQVAQETAGELDLTAEFVLSNVLELDLGRTFDTVFASYGVLGWIPDVAEWMAVAARHLAPGGELILVEFHPLIWLFDEKARPSRQHGRQPQHAGEHHVGEPLRGARHGGDEPDGRADGLRPDRGRPAAPGKHPAARHADARLLSRAAVRH